MPTKVSVPVICIGNVVVGGSGKTPVVADWAKRLKAQGKNPHIISRGYGGTLIGPVRVNPAQHAVGDVGDEPLMLAKTAPVWVAKDRVAGAKAAVEAGADILLLDDGLQNPALFKDTSFLVVDGGRGLGNGAVMPAGPLREAFADALTRVDGIIFIGDEQVPFLNLIPQSKPVLRAKAETVCATHELKNCDVFAFCGLGDAQKFFKGVQAMGARIKGTRSFPDHYVWSRAEVEDLLHKAESMKAIPVTTAKDAVRIPESLHPRLALCDVRLHWQDEAAVAAIPSYIKKPIK